MQENLESRSSNSKAKPYNTFSNHEEYGEVLSRVLYTYDKDEVKESYLNQDHEIGFYETAYSAVREYVKRSGAVSKLVDWENSRLYELNFGDNNVQTLADNPKVMALTNEYNIVKIGDLYYMSYNGYVNLVFTEYNEAVVAEVFAHLQAGEIDRSSKYLIVDERISDAVAEYDSGEENSIIDLDFSMSTTNTGFVYDNLSFAHHRSSDLYWRWINETTGDVHTGKNNPTVYAYDDKIRVEVDDNNDPDDGVLGDTIVYPRACLITDVEDRIRRISNSRYRFTYDLPAPCSSSSCLYTEVEIKLYIDGVLAGTYNQAPFSFNAPGAATIEVDVSVTYNPEWEGWADTDNPPCCCEGSGLLITDCDILHTTTMYSNPIVVNGERWRAEGQVWIQRSGPGDWKTPGEVGAYHKTYKWVNGRWRGGHAPNANIMIGEGHYIDNANTCDLVPISAYNHHDNDTHAQINHDHDGARAFDPGDGGGTKGWEVRYIMGFDGVLHPLTFPQNGTSPVLKLLP